MEFLKEFLEFLKVRKFSIILIILLLVFFFFWGFISATYKKFPFTIIRNIYWNFATTNLLYDKNLPPDKDEERTSYITKFYTNKEFINYQKNIVLKKFKNIKKDSNLFRKKILDREEFKTCYLGTAKILVQREVYQKKINSYGDE